MQCAHFGTCGSCTRYEDSYETQLQHKSVRIQEQFSGFYANSIECFESNPKHFRSRMEFRILHYDHGFEYAMNTPDKKLFALKECHIIAPVIKEAMPKIQNLLQSDELLKHRLYTIEFLSSQSGDLLITLIYHKPLDSEWECKARELQKKLGYKIIGRSRRVKLTLSEDYIEETLNILGHPYRYHHHEGGFTQPNTNVNEKMIQWIMDRIENPNDLLELYCGAGNFTIPLSTKFEKVLTTEVSKTSIKALQENIALNQIDNIRFARLNSEEVVQAFNKEREFRRLKGIDLGSYNFSHIFVDPPRAGMDEATCCFASRFEQILYISCNPDTLHRDLGILTQTHSVKEFAIFDQFPYTHHVECGCVLTRK